jgi:hypothetical protein
VIVRASYVAVVLVAVSLTACGNSSALDNSTTNPSISVAAPKTSAAPWTASVESAQKVITGPAPAEVHGETAWSNDVPAGSTLVTIHWSLAGRGAETEMPGVHLVHGAGKRTADAEAGWASSSGDKALQDPNVPNVVPASGKVVTWGSWIVPTEDLGDLELWVESFSTDAEIRLPVKIS